MPTEMKEENDSSDSDTAEKFVVDRRVRCLFYPGDLIKLFWDTIINLSLIFIGFWAPLALAFYLTKDNEPKFNGVSENVMDCLFFIDIIVTFNSAVLQEDQLVTARKKIAQIYLKKWFWVDLFATLPIDTLVVWLTYQEETTLADDVPSQTNYYRFFRLFRLLRLLKFFKNSSLIK